MRLPEIYFDSMSSTGIVTYRIDLHHWDLDKHRVIKDTDREIIERRATQQLKQWEEQWVEEQQDKARDQSIAAHIRLNSIENTLYYALTKDATLDWKTLKDFSPFPDAKPKADLPPRPKLHSQPDEPNAGAERYRPKFSFFDRFSSHRKDARRQEARERYDADWREWQRECRRVARANEQREQEYEATLARAEEAHQIAFGEWRTAKLDYLKNRRARRKKIDEHRIQWQAWQTEAVEDYCDIVLSRSSYDGCCPQEFNLKYNRENRMLVVDYELPAPDAMPTISDVKYVISRDEIVNKSLSITRQREMYDSLLYQIALRTLHELFEADSVNALDAAVFNGFVRSFDKGTGNRARPCVLSVQANREEFEAIDLKHVEPKRCFRWLKGVGNTKLYTITPVPPLQTLRRDDSRFDADQKVIEALDEGDNVAAMGREDFQHLIREVFAKEFSGNGRGVRVTRASRDGRLDAVAFDPDPIRGGKIVIQAKQSTNTVGVSAVRDLYEAVLIEGAMKGILVSTSSYGADAYAFVRDKPVTLLDGSHLLHLLERHGHKARINLADAKKLMD